MTNLEEKLLVPKMLVLDELERGCMCKGYIWRHRAEQGGSNVGQIRSTRRLSYVLKANVTALLGGRLVHSAHLPIARLRAAN